MTLSQAKPRVEQTVVKFSNGIIQMRSQVVTNVIRKTEKRSGADIELCRRKISFHNLYCGSCSHSNVSPTLVITARGNVGFKAFLN